MATLPKDPASPSGNYAGGSNVVVREDASARTLERQQGIAKINLVEAQLATIPQWKINEQAVATMLAENAAQVAELEAARAAKAAEIRTGLAAEINLDAIAQQRARETAQAFDALQAAQVARANTNPVLLFLKDMFSGNEVHNIYQGMREDSAAYDQVLISANQAHDAMVAASPELAAATAAIEERKREQTTLLAAKDYWTKEQEAAAKAQGLRTEGFQTAHAMRSSEFEAARIGMGQKQIDSWQYRLAELKAKGEYNQFVELANKYMGGNLTTTATRITAMTPAEQEAVFTEVVGRKPSALSRAVIGAGQPGSIGAFSRVYNEAADNAMAEIIDPSSGQVKPEKLALITGDDNMDVKKWAALPPEKQQAYLYQFASTRVAAAYKENPGESVYAQGLNLSAYLQARPELLAATGNFGKTLVNAPEAKPKDLTSYAWGEYKAGRMTRSEAINAVATTARYIVEDDNRGVQYEDFGFPRIDKITTSIPVPTPSLFGLRTSEVPRPFNQANRAEVEQMFNLMELREKLAAQRRNEISPADYPSGFGMTGM